MTRSLDRTNVGRWYISSEELKDPLTEYRRNALRARYRQAAVSVPVDTTDLSHRAHPDVHADLAEQANQRADERHAQALRKAMRSREDDEERQTTSAMRVMGMQKWEGRVIEVDDDYFSVELTPFDDGLVVIADFERELLPEEDDVQVGAVIYVTARTVQDGGGRTRTASIRLRRLGKWTETEIAERDRRAQERAARLAAHIE